MRDSLSSLDSRTSNLQPLASDLKSAPVKSGGGSGTGEAVGRVIGGTLGGEIGGVVNGATDKSKSKTDRTLSAVGGFSGGIGMLIEAILNTVNATKSEKNRKRFESDNPTPIRTTPMDIPWMGK